MISIILSMSSTSRSAAAAPLPHGGDQLLGVELLALTGGADEPVAGPSRVLGDRRTARGDVDPARPLGDVVDGRALEVVVVAVEVDAVPTPQFAHQPHRFAQPREALLELRPFADVAGGDLVERLTGADAEEHPVGIRAGHRRERLRDHRGVVAERRGQHRRAQDEPLGALTDRRHPRQRERGVAAFVPPRLEVVTDRRTVHPVRLGEHRQFDQLTRRELLRRRLVSQFQFSHAFVSTPMPSGHRG